jgi:membrane protease YdiL (CAAX protease family)
VQARLMARHGLLVGSLLTAVPFFLIHLPLAFENNGWQGTTWRDAFITWGVLLVAAPFQRYLIGTLLVDTGGSTLAAGLMHASINAAGAMVIVPGGWQFVPALILLTIGVVGYRHWRGRSATDGYAPAMTPASEAAESMALGVTP